MRAVSVVCVVTAFAVLGGWRLFFNCFRRTSTTVAVLGRTAADLCACLGGAFLKAGQLLSTRADLLPKDAITALQRLQDNVRPLRRETIERVVRKSFGAAFEETFAAIDFEPVASATIAQVHRAELSHSGEIVALKVKRPGIDRVLRADVKLIRLVGRVLSWLPWLRKIPVREATGQVCRAVVCQVDFVQEAQSQRRLRELFATNESVVVPATYDDLCRLDVIVMEYLTGLESFADMDELAERAEPAVVVGLRALYVMIFQAGFVHCDLHPGNILCNAEGQVVLLDMGFVAELSPAARRAFAKFFECIVFKDGTTAAQVVLDTALQVPSQCDTGAFERDMQALIDKAGDRNAAEFQVVGFVQELFQIQRRHAIYGSPDFTMPILALLTFEGLIKHVHPTLDFQREAIPFVLTSLSTPARRRKPAQTAATS